MLREDKMALGAKRERHFRPLQLELSSAIYLLEALHLAERETFNRS